MHPLTSNRDRIGKGFLVFCLIGACLSALAGCTSHYRYVQDVTLDEGQLQVTQCEYDLVNIPFIVVLTSQPTCAHVSHVTHAK